MQPDAIAFLTGLMIVPLLFLIFRRFLFNPKYNTLLFVLALLLSITGLTQVKNGIMGKPNFYLFLLCPLYDLSLLRVLVYFFKSRLHRDPEDPPKRSIFFQDGDGLDKDRFFNIIYLILCLCVPMAILAYFYQ